MKNSITIVLLFTLIHAQSFAQSFLGARAGVNLARFGYHFESNDEEKAARDASSIHPVLQGGIFFRKQVNHFAFQPELCWVQKGVRMKYDFGSTSEILLLTVNYLETPLLLKGIIGNGSKKFSVFAGPAFSYAVGGHNKNILIEDGNRTNDKEKLDFKDVQYNRFEVSAQVGIGGSVKAGKGFFETEARYEYGITKLNDDAADDKYFNRGIAVSIGYVLLLH